MSASARPQVHGIFDPGTWTVTYVVHGGPGTACAVIDPVLDYDPKSGRTRTASADKLIAYLQENRLRVEWILETHAHADHLSAAHYLKARLGGRTGIGEHIRDGAEGLQGRLQPGAGLPPGRLQFDHLFRDGETFRIGELAATSCTCPAIRRPTSPPDRRRRVRGRHLFMPDVGTARCDFPGGDARTLYARCDASWPCRTRPASSCATTTRPTAAPDGASRRPSPSSARTTCTCAKASRGGVRRAAHQARATLDMPLLILPAVQVNIRAGELPPGEDNGVAYLKIPLNAL